METAEGGKSRRGVFFLRIRLGLGLDLAVFSCVSAQSLNPCWLNVWWRGCRQSTLIRSLEFIRALALCIVSLRSNARTDVCFMSSRLSNNLLVPNETDGCDNTSQMKPNRSCLGCFRAGPKHPFSTLKINMQTANSISQTVTFTQWVIIGRLVGWYCINCKDTCFFFNIFRHIVEI